MDWLAWAGLVVAIVGVGLTIAYGVGRRKKQAQKVKDGLGIQSGRDTNINV